MSQLGRRGILPNPYSDTIRTLCFSITRTPDDSFRTGVDIEFNFNQPKSEGEQSSSDDDNIFILPAIYILPQVRGNDTGVIKEVRRTLEVHVLTTTVRFTVSSKYPYALQVVCFPNANPSDDAFVQVVRTNPFGYYFSMLMCHSKLRGVYLEYGIEVLCGSIDSPQIAGLCTLYGPFQIRMVSGGGLGINSVDGGIVHAYENENCRILEDTGAIYETFPPI